MSDDEFVARAGQLWVWIDAAADAGMRVALGAAALLVLAGLPLWLVLLAALVPVIVVTETAIVLERRRLFPPGADPSWP